LVEVLTTAAKGGEDLSGQTEYTVPLPTTSLTNNGSWKKQKFKTRVSVIPPLDTSVTDRLLRVLFTTLNWTMMTGLNPEVLLKRENEKRKDAKGSNVASVICREHCLTCAGGL
jgi:hypothetical protein